MSWNPVNDLKKAFNKLKDQLNSTANSAKNSINWVKDQAKKEIYKVKDDCKRWVKDAGDTVKDGVEKEIKEVGDGIKHEFEGIKGEIEDKANDVKSLAEDAKEEIEKLPETIKEEAEKVLSEVKKGFDALGEEAVKKIFKEAIERSLKVARLAPSGVSFSASAFIGVSMSWNTGEVIDLLQEWVEKPPKNESEIKKFLLAVAPSEVTISGGGEVPIIGNIEAEISGTWEKDYLIEHWDEIMSAFK